MINICEHLNCPYNHKRGCDRFVSSVHCPLLWQEKGVMRLGVEANEYWLFGDATTAYGLRQVLDAFLAEPGEVEYRESRSRFEVSQ